MEIWEICLLAATVAIFGPVLLPLLIMVVLCVVGFLLAVVVVPPGLLYLYLKGEL